MKDVIPPKASKSIRINTYVTGHNAVAASRILNKGRGAWGQFVNEALEKITDKPKK